MSNLDIRVGFWKRSSNSNQPFWSIKFCDTLGITKGTAGYMFGLEIDRNAIQFDQTLKDIHLINSVTDLSYCEG